MSESPILDYKIKDYEIKYDNITWTITKLIIHTITTAICVLTYFLLSASVVYLIQTKNTDIIHNILPNDCRDGPYGTKSVSPCKTPFLFELVAQVFCPPMGYKRKSVHIQGEKDSKVKMPYNWFNNYNGLFIERLRDLYLGSMIKAKTSIHNDVIYTLKILDIIPQSILMLFSLPVITWLIHFVFSFLIFLYLTYYQIKDSIKLFDPIAIIIAMFASMPAFFLNVLLAIFFTIKLGIDVTIKPLFMAWNEILSIIQQNKTLIGYILGIIFIVRLLTMDYINPDYATPFKLVPTFLFVAIVIIHSILSFIKFAKSFKKG